VPKVGSSPSRAVVAGGSLTGLLAARVLADHFDHVLLVERDRFPDGAGWRKGTPQARHVHVLLKQGEHVVAAYFPGICDELVREGSFRVDMAGDTRWLHFGAWKARFPSGMTMLSQSRAFLEWKVRARVAGLSNVGIVDGRSVAGLLLDHGRVRGIRLAADGDVPAGELAADLFVDASGRGSRMPQWLADVGVAAPPETEVRVDVGYASRFYRRPERLPGDWLGLMIYPTPPGTRLGVLFPVEDGRWMVTLVGWFGDHPGGSDAEFLEFARSLDAPDLYDAVRDAEPLSPVALHKFPSNRRRHYERVRNLPDGIAVAGDAFCSFNPIYGQGMTTGALAARTLDRCLGRAPWSASARGFGARFHRMLARVIAAPWMLTTTEDFRSPAADGRRPPWAPLMHWYTERVHRLTWSDTFVARRFLEVMHLTAAPQALFHPYIVCRALGARPQRKDPQWTCG
jgi:2-polyprenyl-6-methoxyphenol hydroxylase-like FAD-dependent oxidoreductase